MSGIDPDALWQATGAGDFVGAKAAVFIGDRLLCLLRDDIPGLAFANHWDFPGGGREPDESPFQTLAREIEEEVGIAVTAAEAIWHWHGQSAQFEGQMSWFFVLRLPQGAERDILFGDEGGGWALMPVTRFLALTDATPSMQDRLSLWLQEEEGDDGEG